MMRALIKRIGLAGASEQGVVLPVVIGLGLAMLTLVAVGMSSAASGTIKTNTDEDINSAIAAAYGGIEEYQSRLALDSTYYKFGNPSAPFSSTSAAGLSLPTGTSTNDAFNITTNGPWANVPNPDPTDKDSLGNVKPTGASFRYEVDNSDYANQGVIRLLSTGRVGQVTESIVANLKQSGFINFLYFTDYETTDPILNPTNTANCAVHTWENRDASCGQIQFGQFDVLGGPVHSNDTLLICSTVFQGTLTTSNPKTPIYQTPGSPCGGPIFQNRDGTANASGAVKYVQQVPMPQTNANMKAETYTDDPADVPNPGCLYTGPTSITFNGDGKMTVVSPYTKFTETNTAATSGTNPTKCGTIAALNSTLGATIPVLDLNLIFVQNVPAPGAGNVNAWPTSAPNNLPAGLTCQSLTQTASGRLTRTSDTRMPAAYSGGFKFGTTQYPLANEVLPASSTSSNPAYDCRNGDLYVKGGLKGRTTLAAEHYVYVTDDITYVDSSAILGLVSQKAIWVWNPIVNNNGSYSYAANTSNLEIDAALLSVSDTFQVQNYDAINATVTNLGDRGTLKIVGAIAQKFRGTVATSNGSSTPATGYKKNYQYDDRYRYTAPPKFLTPVSTTYGVTSNAGVKPAFTWNGTPN